VGWEEGMVLCRLLVSCSRDILMENCFCFCFCFYGKGDHGESLEQIFLGMAAVGFSI
jgi:hypothetical protein